MRARCIGEGVVFSDRVHNLSVGGAGINTLSQLKPGDELELNFRLPEQQRGVRLRAAVVWLVEDDVGGESPNCGLMFKDVAREDKATIDEFVGSVLG